MARSEGTELGLPSSMGREREQPICVQGGVNREESCFLCIANSLRVN